MSIIDWENGSLDDILGIEDIDSELDDFGNLKFHTTADTAVLVNKIIDLEGNSIDLIIENIEIDNNINVKIDHKKKSLSFFDNVNNELIGEIFISAYKDGEFERDKHLYNVIEDKYKGKGWGKILFGLYEIISQSNDDFILPKEEYTNIASMINLNEKFGYIPKYKIVNGIDYKLELDDEDFEDIKNIIVDYKKGYKERRLGYTVVMEKKSV